MNISHLRTALRPFLLTLVLVAPGACGGSAEDEAPRAPIVEGEALGVAGAHEHGVARLGLAVDGSLITVDLEVPAASVYGFERAPESEEELASMTASLDRLRAGAGDLIAFADGVTCGLESLDTFEAPEVPTELGAGHDDDHEHEHEDDHDQADEDDHSHDEDDHSHDEDDHSHDEEDEHAHDEDEHQDVRVVATLRCEAPPTGTAQLNLAGYLSDLEVVDLTVVTPGGQAGARVPAAATFEF